MEEKKPPTEESNSLELETTEEGQQPQSDEEPKKKDEKKGTRNLNPIHILKSLASKLNVYLLGFLVIVVIVLMIFFVTYNANQQQDATTFETQELTQEAVDDLVGSDARVGDPKQLLTVESDSVFSGKVLIRDGLDVAGPIKVGGSLSLPGITVSGISAFDEVTVNTLDVAGDLNVQGQTNIQDGLSVSGPVTFSGTFSAASFSIRELTVEENLTIGRHIDAAGATPRVSGGNALGSGGTATISGTDTAGTVSVNVGAGASAGELATVTFVNPFGGTPPHVVITPVAAQGAAIITGTQKFYLSSRTASSFTIAVSGALPSGSIGFDYIVID